MTDMSEYGLTRPAKDTRLHLPPLPRRLRRLGHYGLALLFVGLAALLRWAMPNTLGPTPFLAFYLAWVGAAAFGGLGPGLLAVSASWVCIDLLFDPNNDLVNFANPTTIGRLVILAAGGLTVSLVAETMRRGRTRLSQSEAQLRTIVDNLTEGLVVSTLDGHLLHWNRAALAMHGFTSLEECRRRLPELADLFELSTADGAVLPVEQWPLARILRGENLRDWEVHIRRLHSDWHRIFSYGGSLVLDEHGRQLLAVVTVNDITQRKEAEQELARSERHYRLLFETMLQGVVYQDTTGKVVSMNPSAEEILGKSPAEFLGRTSVDEQTHTIREDGSPLPGIEHPSMVALKTGQEVRDVVMGVHNPRRKERRWISISAVPLFRPGEDKPYQVYTHFADITARKLAEEAMLKANDRLQQQAEELQAQAEELQAQAEELATANEELRNNEQVLREREEQLRQRVEEVETLMEVAPVAIWVSHDPQCNHIAGNRAANTIYEAYGRENVSANRSPARRFYRNGKELKPEEVPRQEAAARNIDIRNTELDVLLPSGRWLNMLGSASPLLDARGQVRGCIGTFVDITDRRQSEQALRESEERYHHLFEDDLTGDFICTTDGQMLVCNPAFARIFGFSGVQEALGTSMLDLYIDPREREALLETLRQQGRIDRLEVWRKRRDGTPIYVVENLVGRFDDQGGLIEVKGYVFDDTDRRRAEDALRELNATLESKVGQRTSELEHRAKQLQALTLELSQAEDQERRRLAEILHDDLQQVLAAAKFHLGLLSNRIKREPSLHTVAVQVDQMLKDAIEKSRSLSHELSPAVLHHGDFAEALEWLAHQVQTKHGLLVHVDAFGEVKSESDALKVFLYKAAQEMLFNVVKHAKVNEARVRVRRLGRYICLSVSDRGRGLDLEQLRRTPGFGLLSIRERVELLGGRMRIKTVRDKGSTFFLMVPDGELPAVESAGQNAMETPSPVAPVSDRQEESQLRVLLADDHEIVRAGLISLLSDEDTIKVVGQAANGREAVHLAIQLRPDVVIMDVSMPLMDGDEATRQIKQQLPKTRVVALSMFDEPETIERMHAAGAEAYVLKTAPSEELLAAIHGPRTNAAA